MTSDNLDKLRVMCQRIKSGELSDLVAAEMVVEVAEIIIKTGEKLDDTQHRVRRLTVWIAGLSLALVFFGLVEGICTFFRLAR